MGLYDLSRRMERGKKPTLIPSLTAWRTNLMKVGIFVVILLMLARASLVIFALLFQGGLPTFLEIVKAVIAFEQPIFAAVYFAVGGFVAAFVYAVSIITIPLMADRQADAVNAAIGFATHFVGLIITMPTIGHASWHAYHNLVAAA